MTITKIISVLALSLLAVWLGFQVLSLLFAGLVGLVGLAVKLAIPAALVLGVLYVLYRVTGGDKQLPGERKPLP